MVILNTQARAPTLSYRVRDLSFFSSLLPKLQFTITAVFSLILSNERPSTCPELCTLYMCDLSLN